MQSKTKVLVKQRSLGGELYIVLKIVIGTLLSVFFLFVAKPAEMFFPEYLPFIAVGVPVSYFVYKLFVRSVATILVLIIGAFLFKLIVGFYVLGVVLIGLLLFFDGRDFGMVTSKKKKEVFSESKKVDDEEDGDSSYLELNDPSDNLEANGRFRN